MSESKHGDYRIEEEIKASDFTLIENAIEFCGSPHFKNVLQQFHDENYDNTMQWDNEEESTLKQTIIFNEYVFLLDGEMDKFLHQHGVSSNEFLIQVQDVIDGKFTALFEENENLWFVDLLHSWTDFIAFKKSMMLSSKKSLPNGK